MDDAPDLSLTRDLELALRLADIADAITLPRFRAADLVVDRKPDRTPVTDADTAAEDALRAALAHERPDDAVLGEERGDTGASANGRGWVLDPIDGTKNFSRGMPVWATLIGLTLHGRPVLGVVSAPALGQRWWAAPGSGAWAAGTGEEPRRISVSGVADLGDAYVSTTDMNVFREDTVLSGRGLAGWLALTEACWETRAFGDFWQHCLVAEGVLDLVVEPGASAWDLAAPAAIVAEAGGRLTDLSGADSITGGNAVTSNGLLHDAALAALRAG
ncbi:histidinol-phosphatase [Pseudonocardia sp. KRD291]|uniref:histidinol-phosphatase n=1 Tax=Pseudonocardia sp. KRD291 TaxID=2792007 RepID=UPI0027E2EACF|nr:histidinol-phosphatase [Pseudonocardia sp. KRD291]